MQLLHLREEDTSAYLNITSLCGPEGWQVLNTNLFMHPTKQNKNPCNVESGDFILGLGPGQEGLRSVLPGCRSYPSCTNHPCCCLRLLPWIPGSFFLHPIVITEPLWMLYPSTTLVFIVIVLADIFYHHLPHQPCM